MGKNKKNPKTRPDMQYRNPANFGRLLPEGPGCKLRIYDCCVFVIYCPAHDKMAISRQFNNTVVWLPFVMLPEDRSWYNSSLLASFAVLAGQDKRKLAYIQQYPPYLEMSLIELFRFQIPQNLKLYTRVTYFIQLNPMATNNFFMCCQNTGRLTWVSLDIINSGAINNSWGPELTEYSKWIKGPKKQIIREYGLEKAMYYAPRNQPQNKEEFMLKTCGISEMDVERMYKDFVDHCFPSFSMTMWSFKIYMSKHGFEQNEARLVRLFCAFNFNRNGFLSFHELLLGLGSIEPNTAHSETRVKFIFRFYDSQSKGFINESDLRRMLRDIFPKDTLEQFNRRLEHILALLETFSGKLTFDNFIASIESNQIPGTSILCRSKKPVFAQISRNIAAGILENSDPFSIKSVIKKKYYEGQCYQCKNKEYSLLPYLVILNIKGFTSKPTILNGLKSPININIEPYFVEDNAASVALQLVRDFNEIKSEKGAPKSILTDDVDTFMNIFKVMYTEIIQILKSEPRCFTNLKSPFFVLGDIHGNIEDLISLEQVLWKKLPILESKILFLGDYVDRGRWSFECAIYVIALKLLTPNKVFLLRGNHEIRDIQIKYTFQDECIEKYGESSGTKLWIMLNNIFDRMPVCAVVDNCIFGSHGGIPYSVKTLQEIENVPTVLRNPEKESKAAWEIMWSDPIDNEGFAEVCEMKRINMHNSKGFVPNNKRGTAYLFNEEGIVRFFNMNKLTHIVRGHEVPTPGFRFHFGEKCLTVFSCSHYCGSNNLCACLLIDKEVIRIIRVDTSNNSSATD